MMKFILFMIVLAACSSFTFYIDNPHDKHDFWGNVVNFVLAIMLAIIVYTVIVAVPIILLGIAFVVLVCLFAILLAWIHSLFIK